MSQPYPGPPGYHPSPYMGPPARTYKPLRQITVVFLVLMVLTTLVAVLQAVLMWRSYDDVKRLVYGLLSEDELARGVESIGNSGPLLDLVSLLVPATGVFFVIWLWKARENTEVFTPSAGVVYQGAKRLGNGVHRREQGWVIGSWICPIVQFWYPLQVVEDVVRASAPPTEQPGRGRAKSSRGLLYTWWAAWTTFWLIIVGGSGFALASFIVWVVRLVHRKEVADATGDYVDIYDLQSFMVRTALAVNIGFTVAAVLLAVAGVAIVWLMFRTNVWQDERMAPRITEPPAGPPQYAPRPPDFPSYAPYPPSSLAPPPYAPSPRQPWP
ncbi:DUF4328 domain-containing protein [Kribbella sp. NBC_00382]|uniref:DUF4328 domain-containing protein n=1 Tax=Kribbella sp. NBC_00382 TaxID=2975967 RepID=UPI002E1F2EE8